MKVLIADVKPGMKLAKEVKGANGRLLLPSGIVLEEQHLRIFNIWGVTEVEVVENGAAETVADEDELLAAAEDHAEQLFQYADLSVPPMAALKAASIKEYLNILQEGGELPTPSPAPEKEPRLPDAPFFVHPLDLIGKDADLASFPDIYYRIMEALENPLTTSNTLADIISKDPGISARLLTLVNSPLYGFGRPIDSLNRAVSMVGTKALSQLALGVTVMDRFKGLDDKHFTMADFWQHSLSCAAINRILATQIMGVSQDLCFVAGMLHDLGRLVMLQIAPEEVHRAHILSRFSGMALVEAEKQIFGFDHCDVAEALFNLWNFPADLSSAAVFHHGMEDERKLQVEAAICTVGDTLAIAMQYGSGGNEFVHTIPREAWRKLGIPESVLAVTMVKARRQISDILTVFTR